jgi:hypothetical protein
MSGLLCRILAMTGLRDLLVTAILFKARKFFIGLADYELFNFLATAKLIPPALFNLSLDRSCL